MHSLALLQNIHTTSSITVTGKVNTHFLWMNMREGPHPLCSINKGAKNFSF